MQFYVAVVLFQEGRGIDGAELLEAGQAVSLIRASGPSAEGHLVRTERQRALLADHLRKELPKVICLVVGRDQVPAASAFLNLLRGIPETTSVVMAGSMATLQCNDFTPNELVQAIFLGQWIEALAEYALATQQQGIVGDVPGAMVRGFRGWRVTERRAYKPNLAEWPDPALDDFRLPDILRLRGGSLPIRASRGFAFRSLFSEEPIFRDLQKADFHYHLRPPGRVVEEARLLKEKDGATSFEFVDDIFPWLDGWVRDFVKEWKEQVDLPFAIRSAAEYVTSDRLKNLRSAKLKSVELCLDAGDERLRQQHSDVNQTNDRVIEAVSMINSIKIKSRLRLMLAVPGETPETIRATTDLAREAHAAITSAEIHRPWPDSDAWVETEEKLLGAPIERPRRPQGPHAHLREALLAVTEIRGIDAVHRARARERHKDAVLDAFCDFPSAVVRAPSDGAARLERVHAPGGSYDSILLRVPSELRFDVKFPRNPILEFGVIVKPELAGERTRTPVSVSVLVSQRKRAFRVFQKVFIQALDPDSRRWHWFSIPVTGVGRGDGTVVLENIVMGEPEGTAPPEHDIWVAWARLVILPESKREDGPREHPHYEHVFDAGRGGSEGHFAGG